MMENFEGHIGSEKSYQSKEEERKNTLEFKIEQLEESIESLRNRIENIENPNLKRPLEIQLENTMNNSNKLKNELIGLEKDINSAEDNDGPIN